MGETNTLISMLSEAPDSQLDGKMRAKLKDLVGKTDKEVADGILYVLDHSARGALASDFVMQVLHLEWKKLGGTVEAGNANCPWRNE
jgi:hypothetical protein